MADDDALPRAIGAPATRALHGVGITRIDQVAGRTEAELGALHGVGPKALRLLREALAERGLSFGDGRPAQG
jgi:predicted flap endonuclease-1-like 5' DNA nuclease